MSVQVEELVSQNKRLQAALQAKAQEVEALQDVVRAASHVRGGDGADKVIELAKKNRALQLSVEKEKGRVAKLEQALSLAAQANPAVAGTKAVCWSAEGAAAATAQEKEAASLRERLASMTNRLAQAEQKAVALEAEHKKALRALVREVGEEVPLSKVLEEGTDWKGRREVVIALRDQIRQLKEEQGLVAPTRHDNTHRFAISKATKDRSAELEQLQAELAGAHAAHERMREQWAGAMSRRKVLEGELASLRQKVQVVLKKTDNDEKLIVALRNELALAAGSSSSGVGSSSGGASSSSQSGGVWGELVTLRQRCAEQDGEIDRQQKLILYLQASQSPNSTTTAVAAHGCAGAHRTACSASDEGTAAVREQVDALQDENEDLRQQVTLLKDELAVQRPGTSSRSEVLRRQVLTLEQENESLRAAMQQCPGPAAAVQLVQGVIATLDP